MTDNHAITAESLLRALPNVLREDTVTLGLASAIAAELEEAASKVSLVNIYANIDTMDESMLDILAKDFKVDWWRSNADLEEKRNLIKTCWYVHRHLGTKSAIETAIASFLGDGTVQEWFEYGGQPHHFRIVGASNAAVNEYFDEFMAILSVVQRGSSVIDSVTALIPNQQNLYIATAARFSISGAIRCNDVGDALLAIYANDDVTILTDENGNILTDGNGNILRE